MHQSYNVGIFKSSSSSLSGNTPSNERCLPIFPTLRADTSFISLILPIAIMFTRTTYDKVVCSSRWTHVLCRRILGWTRQSVHIGWPGALVAERYHPGLYRPELHTSRTARQGWPRQDTRSITGLCYYYQTCMLTHWLLGDVVAILTRWDRDEMAVIFQTTYSYAFCGMKMYEFRLRFHKFVPKGPINNIL